MSSPDEFEPIIACSTGEGVRAAISVIRLSGFRDLADLALSFSDNLSSLKPRYAHFCSLVDSNRILDEVIVVFFKGPNSYNGENILEIHAHGNPLNVKKIINHFISVYGFRYAKPGEFTLRALANKKMNLSQVEGLDTLLNANSSYGLSQGLSLLNGDLGEKYSELYKRCLEFSASIELMIDFADDVGEEQGRAKLKQSFEDLFGLIKELKSRVSCNSGELLRPSICLLGEPNSGKSTFFNEIVGFARAIVTEEKGTTRDFLSEVVEFREGLFRLIDTAGIRDAENRVEQIGVEKALELFKNAFFKIFLVDCRENNLGFLPSEVVDLVVITHCDGLDLDILKIKLSQVSSVFTGSVIATGKFGNALKPLYKGHLDFGPIEPAKSGPIEPAKSGPIEPVKSGPIEPVNSGPIEPVNSGPIEPVKSGPIEPAKSGPIEPLGLREIIEDLVADKYGELVISNPIILERHSYLIDQSYQIICEINELGVEFNDIGLIDKLSKDALRNISELSGVIEPEEVLSHIFSNFCIGK